MRKLILVSLLSFFIYSCNDALDIVQDGEINNENTFKTVDDLRTFLLGDVYRRVNITNEIGFTAVFTDEVGIGHSSGGQGKELHRYNFFPTDGNASSLWIEKYGLINRINRLIAASDLITINDADDELKKNSILAEARTLRAWAYLQLIAFYSTDASNDNALGVILLDFVPTLEQKLPRVSNAEIYALIEADLAYAESNLSTNININPFGVNYKYVTPPLIDAIRARMYLYRKNYSLAEQYANAVITSFGAALPGSAGYNQMWNDLAKGEIIFAASRPSAGTWGNVAGLFFFNTTDVNGGVFHDMGRNLFNLLDASSTDIRRQLWVDATSVFDPNYDDPANTDYVDTDRIVINKYPGKASQPLRNDLKLFRLSEIYLILAEAQVGKSSPDLAQAAAYVQTIRTARNTGQSLPTYNNAQEAWADILLERRKELCFEGHRYVDIKRLGSLAGGLSIDRHFTDDEYGVNTPLTLPLSDHRFTFPIPQNEVAGNVTIQQNPGY